MNRSRVIVEATALAIVGVLLPLSVAIYAAWALSVKAEKERLDGFATLAISRTEKVIDTTAETLRGLDRSVMMPCSDGHIAEMRRLTMNSRSIREIGYINDGLLRCTSWGQVTTKIEKKPADFTIGRDIEAWAAVAPRLSGADPMTVVQVGKHNALIDPLGAIDVLADRSVHVSLVAPNGALTAGLQGMDEKRVQELVKAGQSGVDDDYVYAVTSHGGWTAVATSDRARLQENFHEQIWLFLPFGALGAIFILAVIFRLSRKRLSPLGDLQIAIHRREFIVHYQPIVELQTGNCIGAEALVRWKRPDGSLVRPDQFIPLAEQSGLIEPITDLVIEAVVKEMQVTLVRHRDLHMSINFCADDFRTGRLLGVLETRLAHSGIEYRQIWLEATERGLMDIEEASRTITEARARGYAVAIDDFGTGYSSLQYLQSLRFDALKIDKSFVDTINRESATSSVVPHIIDMAKALGLSVIAEGVETKEQAEYLIERGAEYAQGWYYGKPMPAEQFITYVEGNIQRRDSGMASIPRNGTTRR
ncbi:EAL domain-containing protein [Neorhizobium sp. NCHU2750]|uniref:EAL domain-containing protein n=1 Tax=Neorhizobium sp. NCHU2750 TaxID=1825976 RepID=UPI000E71B08E